MAREYGIRAAWACPPRREPAPPRPGCSNVRKGDGPGGRARRQEGVDPSRKNPVELSIHRAVEPCQDSPSPMHSPAGGFLRKKARIGPRPWGRNLGDRVLSIVGLNWSVYFRAGLLLNSGAHRDRPAGGGLVLEPDTDSLHWLRSQIREQYETRKESHSSSNPIAAVSSRVGRFHSHLRDLSRLRTNRTVVRPRRSPAPVAWPRSGPSTRAAAPGAPACRPSSRPCP